MPIMKRWTADIFSHENDGSTYAEACLHSGDGRPPVGIGRAKLHPADYDVPGIGDELAAARALNDLGHRLLMAAIDIAAITPQPVHADPNARRKGEPR